MTVQSNVRAANDISTADLRANLLDGETYSPDFIKSYIKEDTTMMIMSPYDMIGGKILNALLKDGQ